MRLWPEMITIMLWPFALKHAADRHNLVTINSHGWTPLERFSGERRKIDASLFHTWGCPTFVLDDRLQSGSGKAPKWEPRSRLGVYLGISPFHANSVALVLNPKTGHVSPQYHVIFDDDYSTLSYMRQSKIPPHWKKMITKSSKVISPDYSHQVTENWDMASTEPQYQSTHNLRVPPLIQKVNNTQPDNPPGLKPLYNSKGGQLRSSIHFEGDQSIPPDHSAGD